MRSDPNKARLTGSLSLNQLECNLKRVFLGFLVLTAMLFLPLTVALVNAWSDSFRMYPPVLIPLLKVAPALLFGIVASYCIVVASGVKARLRRPIKGANLMLAGAVLSIAFPALLAAMAIQGSKSAFLQFVTNYGLTNYPAFIVLIAGAWHVLTHLEPRADQRRDT
jgi:hypothetical protein